jgi:hypothetical protein
MKLAVPCPNFEVVYPNGGAENKSIVTVTVTETVTVTMVDESDAGRRHPECHCASTLCPRELLQKKNKYTVTVTVTVQIWPNFQTPVLGPRKDRRTSGSDGHYHRVTGYFIVGP